MRVHRIVLGIRILGDVEILLTLSTRIEKKGPMSADADYTDPEHNPMIPHVIVLEPGLVIFKIYNGYWFFGRPTIEELRQDLRAVLKKCRPDWDISRPELKAAWERGEHDRFYP